jgi:uncharacterized protein (DUF2062 family)
MIQKIKGVIQDQLTQGVTPHGLALTVAFAVTLGIFPVLGSTTVLCFLAALFFRLNQPVIQILNYVVYPLQILVLPFFLKAGQRLFQAPELTVDLELWLKEFAADASGFLVRYSWVGLRGIVVWLLVAPPLGLLVYFSMKPLLVRMDLRRRLMP